MTLFFNILFAWFAVISCVLLSVIWLIRLIWKKVPKGPNKDLLISTNKLLRKKHIKLGYLFLIFSFMHGMLSSFSLMSFNYGTLTFVLGVLLCYTYIDKSNLGKLWMIYHRRLTVLLIVATVIHVIEVGGFVGVDKVLSSIKSDLATQEQLESDEDDIVDFSNVEYNDGIYEGIGTGYRPNLKVQVTVKNGLIDEILIVEHNEVGRRFYIPAFESVPMDIIEKQSTQVDMISGATYSSMGIIEAVENALSKSVK